ncbi:MAG: gliding motility lipoprotein GldB, partial [Polaribacter sp.]
MRVFLVVFILFSTLLSCNKDTPKTIDLSKIDVHFSIDRFDVNFYNTSVKTLSSTKKKYPLLFPKDTKDSVWISKINDTDEQELFAETQKLYKDFSSTKKQLTSLFKHIKYYNPKFKSPKVITMLTNIDYDNRILYADSLLLISLDAYLGKNHEFYADYPKYIKENNTKEHIIVDVANAIIDTQIAQNNSRTFVSKIIYEGKKLYLSDLYLPTVSDKEKIGYTKDKLAWAESNEEQIWKYFIENKLLFSTDTKLNKRFIENA